MKIRTSSRSRVIVRVAVPAKGAEVIQGIALFGWMEVVMVYNEPAPAAGCGIPPASHFRLRRNDSYSIIMLVHKCSTCRGFMLCM